jgi:N-acetylmuramoyl-L-alanine amidase
MSVVIDAGHGLPDPGACGFVKEYEVVLKLAQLVKAMLERHGVKIVMTRTGDKSLSNVIDLKQNKHVRVLQVKAKAALLECLFVDNQG